MPTLRRILKYTPALVLGLLMVAWLMSFFRAFGLLYESRANSLHFWIERGNFRLNFLPHSFGPHEYAPRLLWEAYRAPLSLQRVLGVLAIDGQSGATEFVISVPLVLLVTSALPAAIGPFLSFRFRLWHYLAYTALVAVELAYYLRWQE